MIYRNGEIDVHVKAKSSAFNPGTMCKLESNDSGELDLLIGTMKTIKESKLRDILLWFRRPNFHMYKRNVEFIDQELDQVQNEHIQSVKISLLLNFSPSVLQLPSRCSRRISL